MKKLGIQLSCLIGMLLFTSCGATEVEEEVIYYQEEDNYQENNDSSNALVAASPGQTMKPTIYKSFDDILFFWLWNEDGSNMHLRIIGEECNADIPITMMDNYMYYGEGEGEFRFEGNVYNQVTLELREWDGGGGIQGGIRSGDYYFNISVNESEQQFELGNIPEIYLGQFAFYGYNPFVSIERDGDFAKATFLYDGEEAVVNHLVYMEKADCDYGVLDRKSVV